MIARPNLMRLSARVALVLTAASLVGVVLAGPASAAAPKLGIYDCTSSATPYVNSVRLMSGGRYVYASQRVGTKLRGTTRGRYKASGTKITWLSGVYKRGRYVSTIHKGYFSIDRSADRVWTGISCYYQRKPS